MRTSMGGKGKARGFTLIELMVVVAVVAILAAIAYPSYQTQVRKSYRAQAKADLVEYAGLAERFYTANNSYANFTLPKAVSPRENNALVRYNLAIGNHTATTFTITATPTGTTGQDKDKCGTLSINQAGVKTNGSGASQSECW